MLDPHKIALLYLQKKALEEEQRNTPAPSRKKTAGEVIFRKDNGGEGKNWSKGGIAPSKRAITGDFNYSPKNVKQLAVVLRSCSAAMGHAISAHNRFFRIKSSQVSPDGSLGGSGFIMTISDIRSQLSNVCDALSRISDTLHDEVNAPYWSATSRQDESEEGQKIKDIILDSEKIRQSPDDWADQQIEEEFED